MNKINSNVSYKFFNKPLKEPKIFTAYHSESFQPLPQIGKTFNLYTSKKNIRFQLPSRPSTLPKLPNIGTRSEPSTRYASRPKRTPSNVHTSYRTTKRGFRSRLNYAAFGFDSDTFIRERERWNRSEEELNNVERPGILKPSKSLNNPQEFLGYEISNSPIQEITNFPIEEIKREKEKSLDNGNFFDANTNSYDTFLSYDDEQTERTNTRGGTRGGTRDGTRERERTRTREEARNKMKKVLLLKSSLIKMSQDNILVNDDLKNYQDQIMSKKERKEQSTLAKENSKSSSGEPFWPSIEKETSQVKIEDPMNKLDLKFGSSLSEDGNFAMLKCYEDMLCSDIRKLNPNLTKEMTRTKTNMFMSLPRKFESREGDRITNKPPLAQNAATNNNNNEQPIEDIELKKHRIRVSKQLDKAMKIYDVIKRNKGELTTTPEQNENGNGNGGNVKNVLGEYKVWKKSWNRIFS